MKSPENLALECAALGVQVAVSDNMQLRAGSAGWDMFDRPVSNKSVFPLYCTAKPVLGLAFVLKIATIGVKFNSTVRDLLPWAKGIDPDLTIGQLSAGFSSEYPLPAAMAVSMPTCQRKEFVRGMLLQATSVAHYDEAIQWIVYDEICATQLGVSLGQAVQEQLISMNDGDEGLVWPSWPSNGLEDIWDQLILDGLQSEQDRIPHLAMLSRRLAKKNAPEFLSRGTALGMCHWVRTLLSAVSVHEDCRKFIMKSGERTPRYVLGGFDSIDLHLGADSGLHVYGSYSGGGSGLVFADVAGSFAACALFTSMAKGVDACRARFASVLSYVEPSSLKL